MRVILGVLSIILATAPVGAAQYGQMMGGIPPPRSQSVPKETLKGYLVDKACAQHATSLAAVGPAHSVQCSIAAHDAGLGVIADGKWVAFDEKGSKKAVEFLKKATAGKNARVTVTGRLKGNVFAVSSIENVKP